MKSTGRPTNCYDTGMIQNLLTNAQRRGLMRQFDNLDQIPRELLAFIEPTSLQAKIGEFLCPGAGAGVGSPLFMWAPITSSQCLREGTWHAFEVLIGQRPGVAILVAVNEAECPLHAVTRTALGLFSEKRASRRRPDQAETDGAPGLSGL
jgi:hypothetical protein